VHDFTLLHEGNEYTKNSLTTDRDGVFIWLHIGEEPSEHILNEIYKNVKCFIPHKDSIHLIIDYDHIANETLERVVEALELKLFTEKEPYNEILARRVFCEPECYPFIMVFNDKGNCLCAKSGYYVGYSNQILRILNR